MRYHTTLYYTIYIYIYICVCVCTVLYHIVLYILFYDTSIHTYIHAHTHTYIYISVQFRNFLFWPMLVAWFLRITAGYVLEDVLAIVKLRTGTLEIFPEARGRARGIAPKDGKKLEKLGEDPESVCSWWECTRSLPTFWFWYVKWYYCLAARMIFVWRWQGHARPVTCRAICHVRILCEWPHPRFVPAVG